MSLRNFISSLTVNGYGFFASFIGPHNPLTRSLYRNLYFVYKRFLEDDLITLLDNYPTLVRGGEVLDIGANIGYTATILSRYIDPDHKVIAFEPELANFETLLETIDRRSLSNVECHQLAVGERSGDALLTINKLHPGDHRITLNPQSQSNEIRTSKLVSVDGFAAEHLSGKRICFAKVDVQGYELSVCRGMSQTILSNPELKIFLEFSPPDLLLAGASGTALIEWLSEYGFEGYRMDGSGKLQQIVSAQLCLQSEYTNILFSRQPPSVAALRK